MKANLTVVLESYHRCEQRGGMFDSFYEILFAKSPQIPPKFANTNMERQKQDLTASVLMAIRLATGGQVAREYVQALAASHSRDRHNVNPELYSLWLDALCQAVQNCDPQFTPELELQWRMAMHPAIELMSAAY